MIPYQNSLLKYCFILLIIISLGSGADYFQYNISSPYIGSSILESFNIPDTLRLVGLMAQFPYENPDNSKTSGNGRILSEEIDEYIHFFESNHTRCDGFKVDKPPHNASYFQSQLEAAGNYYEMVSNGHLTYTSEIILNSNSLENGYYNVSHEMQYYATGDNNLAKLFMEVIDSAKNDIENHFDFSNNNITPDDLVFVVFHAGLGGDFTYPSVDPTIYDLKSAYIDEGMILDIEPVLISGTPIRNGILLPETQNMIYYDVVEDIFGNPDYGTEDLCDIQIGMTGIFVMLLGFELGLPPMYNTDNGKPGVGYFGLMDFGSNNGRGVMPALPNPWTRIKAGWSQEVNIKSLKKLDSILIKSQELTNEIIRIDIDQDEYFLFENRNNWVFHLVDIDSLRRKNKIDDNKLGYWFDSVINEFTNDQLLKDENTNVITQFNHYDYGLPGSGLLIWHIKEPDIGLYSLGINNDLSSSHILIEEADGSQDIGYESYAFFSSDDPTMGTRWDMWYSENEAYLDYANPYSEKVIFNNSSNPNTRTSNGANSFVSITILSNISDSMYIDVKIDNTIEIVRLSDNRVQYLGNAIYENTAAIFYEEGGNIYKTTSNNITTLENLQYSAGKFIYTFEDQLEYTLGVYCIHPVCENFEDEIYNRGYVKYFLDSTIVPESLSLGDIDEDGLDEIITIENGNIIVSNYSDDNSYTYTNGFPVYGNFSGVPLIANIWSVDDNKPEIICRENDEIIIISNRGKRLFQLASINIDQPLALIPNWDGNMALVDGARLLLFDLELNYSYWLNPSGRPSGLPLTTGLHFLTNNSNLFKQKAYNYPNPITEGQTTFRFFVDSITDKIQIKIYDAAGYLLKDDLELINPVQNEFNEIKWMDVSVDSGLYLAEIKHNSGESELVRLVVIK